MVNFYSVRNGKVLNLSDVRQALRLHTQSGLPTAFCLRTTAFCLRPFAYGLQPFTYRLQPIHYLCSMRNHIQQLARISRKRTRTIIGLMSGTSLDGLDIALCSVSGSGSNTKVRVKRFVTLPYAEEFKQEIRKVFAREIIDFALFTVLNVQVAEAHAAMVNQMLSKWKVSPEKVDCIASHGQTVYHAPRALHGRADWPNATIQIGDGDHLARRTGVLTICDFRQKHVAAGGEGAPLSLYGDYFLFSEAGVDRFLLNVGGIANFTYLPGDGDSAKAFATDTGPGNTLLDAVARRDFGQAFDRDSLLALNGVVQPTLLHLLHQHPYFDGVSAQVGQYRSQTTGPEMFSLAWLDSCLAKLPKGGINPFDLMATLSRFTAECIAAGMAAVPTSAYPRALYLSGGGAHNPLIMQHLRELLPHCSIDLIDALGLSGDAKEACLFAILANETLAGQTDEGRQLGGVPLVGMGKICFPG
jgi:anhydro-N-acetylmuramic acid kinase